MMRPFNCRIASAVLSAFLLNGSGLLAAAPPNAAHWSVQPLAQKTAHAGATFVVKLAAQIEPGWHIYAMDEPEGGPIPTQIGLAEGDPLMLLSVDAPEPRMVPDPVLRQLIGMFQNSAEFTLHVRWPHKTTGSPAGNVSHVLVRYQSCNDQVCLPPRTETLSVALPQ